jgi:putative transcriptional regulator
MTHPPRERLRSYAEGQTDVTTRLLVEAHLALCPMCLAHVAEDQRAGDRLPDATLHDELDLPSFQRVWRAVERVGVHDRGRDAAVLPARLLAALPPPSGWRWVSAWPQRVKSALLIRDTDTGSELYLTYFSPGSTFPRHRHIGLEENVIVAGGYRSGDLRVDAGDWVTGPPGTEEMPTTDADEECWCLSRIEPPGVRFIGWRRWVVPLLVR